VDSAFGGFHTDLMKLRGQRSVKDVEQADVLLKVIRQAAVKAIHATATLSCAKHDDRDEQRENENDDEDEAHAAAPATTASLVGDRHNDEDNGGDHPKTKPAPMTFSGDATAIADQAVAAMQVAFDGARNAAASTPKPAPTHKPQPTRGPKNGHRD
jgi:hypothetical protein